MQKGIGVSPGVAVGTAYCIDEIFVNPDTKRLEASEVQAELGRYDQARDRTAIDLHALYEKVASQVGSSEAAIFQGPRIDSARSGIHRQNSGLDC